MYILLTVAADPALVHIFKVVMRKKCCILKWAVSQDRKWIMMVPVDKSQFSNVAVAYFLAAFIPSILALHLKIRSAMVCHSAFTLQLIINNRWAFLLSVKY